MAKHALAKSEAAPPIPDKLYFKIGEVSELIGVEPYVLRYWETEFREISPVKSRTNQRLYKRRDVETILKIKELLYKERFTINGARKRLKEDDKGESAGVSQLGLTFAPAEPAGAVPAGLKGSLAGEIGNLMSEMIESLRSPE